MLYANPKGPNAVVNYVVDWSDWLNNGDSIANSSWQIDVGLTSSNAMFDTSTTTIRIGGGKAGMTYYATNTMTTAGGEVWQESLQIQVKFPV